MRNSTSTTDQIDPTLASDPTRAMSKLCRSCCADLPMENFGLAKTFGDGRNITCKACRTEDNSDRWTRKHGRSMPHQKPDVIRSVVKQNTSILTHAFSHTSDHTSSFTCIGFIPHTDKVFSIVFGRNRHDMESCAIFLKDGTSYFEIVYSGIPVDRRLSILLANLKEHNIRLEYGEAYMLASKNVIYWYKP